MLDIRFGKTRDQHLQKYYPNYEITTVLVQGGSLSQQGVYSPLQFELSVDSGTPWSFGMYVDGQRVHRHWGLSG